MSNMPNKEHFQALVLAHLNSAFNLAYWLTRSRQDAEDVVQEACIRAFRYFDAFHGEDARAWLLAIVRNTFYTWYCANRKREGTMEFDEERHSHEDANFAEREDNPEALLMRKDNQRVVRTAIERLPLAYREVIVLRELEDFSYKEIAGIVDISIGTVMSRLGRGRKLLAAMLVNEAREE
jgi:RNA polymerase sigma-70 factor (ECF subfamily)